MGTHPRKSHDMMFTMTSDNHGVWHIRVFLDRIRTTGRRRLLVLYGCVLNGSTFEPQTPPNRRSRTGSTGQEIGLLRRFHVIWLSFRPKIKFTQNPRRDSNASRSTRVFNREVYIHHFPFHSLPIYSCGSQLDV